MSEFTVETQGLKKNAAQMKDYAGILNRAVGELNSLKNQLHFSGSFAQIKGSLGRISTALSSEKGRLDVMSNMLGQIAAKYESTEREVAGRKWKPEPFNIPWSLIIGTLGKRKIPQFPNAVLYSGDLFGASYSVSNNSGVKWKYVKDKNGNKIKVLDSISLVDVKASGEAHVAKGSVKGNVGLAKGEIEGAVGTVGATGALSATLFKNGKFDPQLNADVGISAAVAKGSMKGSIGTEDTNVHVRGEAEVASAEASARGSAGRFTVEDKATGRQKTVIGVKGEAKAEAYLAQGRVSGGVSFFGINIEVGVTGKAGGAGVSAGGSVTTGGASGSIGAGLGAGLGLDVSIDWSGFKPFGKK